MLYPPPAIGRTPFFLHACLRPVPWRYAVLRTPDEPQHHDQKDASLSQLSDLPLAVHGRNDAFDVYRIGAGFDSNAALRWRNNRV